jgi:flagellar hook protein FlgE
MTTYTYTTLNNPLPGSGGSSAPGSINDKGQVTGSYANGTNVLGFLYSDGAWTTLSDPAAGADGFTIPTSINDRGQVTGRYSNERTPRQAPGPTVIT